MRGTSEPPRPDASSTEGFINTADGTRLLYSIAGSGASVLVAPLACWLAADLKALARDRRVVFYDPRGRGRSDPIAAATAIGIDRDVDDLEELRAALRLETIGLFGWSYYGAVVARYALKHPAHVDRIVMLGPLPPRRTPYFDQGAAAVKDRLDPKAMAEVQTLHASGAAANDPVAFCRAWGRALLPAYVADRRSLDRRKSNPCAHANEHPMTLNAFLGRLWQSMGEWDWRRQAAELSAPTLVLHGDADFQAIEGSREWCERPSARLETIAGAGHIAWLDQPEPVINAIDRFLRGPIDSTQRPNAGPS